MTQLNDIQHDDTQHAGVVCDTQHNFTLHFAESRYAECHNFFLFMLTVIMLSVVKLRVFMQSVVAPI
jgi:hypothetical protein